MGAWIRACSRRLPPQRTRVISAPSSAGSAATQFAAKRQVEDARRHARAPRSRAPCQARRRRSLRGAPASSAIASASAARGVRLERARAPRHGRRDRRPASPSSPPRALSLAIDGLRRSVAGERSRERRQPAARARRPPRMCARGRRGRSPGTPISLEYLDDTRGGRAALSEHLGLLARALRNLEPELLEPCARGVPAFVRRPASSVPGGGPGRTGSAGDSAPRGR